MNVVMDTAMDAAIRAETVAADSPTAVSGTEQNDAPMPGGLPNFDVRQRAALRVVGQALMTAGQYAQARVVFTALLHLDPTHTGDLLAAATAFQAEGQYAQAASLLDVCLLLGSTAPDAALRLAECRLALGNAPAAHLALELAEQYASVAGDASTLARVALMRGGLAD